MHTNLFTTKGSLRKGTKVGDSLFNFHMNPDKFQAKPKQTLDNLKREDQQLIAETTFLSNQGRGIATKISILEDELSEHAEALNELELLCDGGFCFYKVGDSLLSTRKD